MSDRPSGPSPEPGRLGEADLIGWFATDGRDLPWRHTRDPWAIVVAELMLQQTQVSRVIERWHRFLERFPTVDGCAAVPVADVIDEWSGLGYNRRAVNLHRLAGVVVADHGGRFPRDLRSLLELPGVGPYTARAIRVFAFEEPDAVLDTNVARILARTSGRGLGRRQAQETADRNLDRTDPWTWNQALLDVGARFCRPRNPDCPSCPFRSLCRWHGEGRRQPDPAVGSAGVSTGQATFEGSDRQGRGRLVRALRDGPIANRDLPAVMGWPRDRVRAERVAAALIADGLAEPAGDNLILPR